MGENEEYFPRGGKKPTVLFKKSSNFLGEPEKGEKKKKRSKKRADGDDGYLSDDETREIDVSAKNCAIGLSYKTVKQGTLVLCRVKLIQETKMLIMLPCRLVGHVMACHISEAYNKLLEAYVNDQTENVPKLSDMFKPGQYIAVKVLEVQERNLMLSTMPQHVNGAKQPADIVKGALFQAAVSSVEDHGFVMDLGIPNTTAFLPKKEVNPELELDVGKVTWCGVMSVSASPESCIVTLSTALSALQGGVLRRKQNTPLLPGTTVEFTVDTPLDNGIEGTIFGDTTSYIQRQHVDKVKGKKPELGQKIRARVLYVLPTRNSPFLTMKSIFESTFPDLAAEQKLKDGDIVEDAQVLKVVGRSVMLKLGRGVTGVLSLRSQQFEDLEDEDDVSKTYPVGSTHKVRVICYNLSDYTYSVSDKPSVVDERFFSYEQLAPGDLVPATVRSVSEKLLELQVGRLKGFVQQTHMTEAGVFLDPKKARTSNLSMKKYKVGQSVQARVLWVDLGKQTMGLTLKPSLLAEDLEPLVSYHQAQLGRQYRGVIRFIRDYIIVSFFNNVRAYIPRWFATQDARAALADCYHLGQAVSCTLVDIRPDEERMTASLITAPFTADGTRKPTKIHEKRKRNKSDSEELSPKKRKTDDVDLESKRKDKNKEEESDTTSNKKKKNKQQIEEIEEPDEEKPKKKKKRNDTDTSQENNDVEDSEKHTKKKKKKRNDTESSQENMDIDVVEKVSKKKKKTSVSEEESDPIETDAPEEELLTPHEQGLLDMSDCSTIKQYKKRLVALEKAIGARAKRIQKIDKKIESIEEKGLTANNKKYHTAMQSEKLQIEDRIKKLAEALNTVEEKLKEMGSVKNDSYKEEQKKRKQEKLKALKEKKKEIKESKVNNVDESVKEDVKHKIANIKVVESLEPALEIPSAKDFWSASIAAPADHVEEEDSSSSEDESQEQSKKKRKKLSVAEKLAKVRAEEDRVRAMEAAALESEHQPRSVDQFERAALASPASSQLWIAYMAFHLQATELDKARAVGRRALAAIPFREEQEKLNVWLALLNLEHRFGTKESQQKTLEDALQLNEPSKVHSSLLDILVDTGKQHELSALVDLMLRKYKRDPEVYIKTEGACFQLGLVEKARQVMQKAIAVLDKKQHVQVLVQSALLERAHGGRERAEALLEQVLAVYPARVDVCAAYVDMLLKTGDAARARQVLDRMTSQKLPARKMKILYKKWVEVEEKYGDAASVGDIKQRALLFIEKAQF